VSGVSSSDPVVAGGDVRSSNVRKRHGTLPMLATVTAHGEYASLVVHSVLARVPSELRHNAWCCATSSVSDRVHGHWPSELQHNAVPLVSK
jgi:hypothetical protein